MEYNIFKKSILICLILLCLVNSGAFANGITNSTSSIDCGKWSTDGKKTSEDGRVGIKLVTAADASCEGNFTLSNKTGTFLGGGYTLELTTIINNASVTQLETSLLIPVLDVDVQTKPINRSDPATVWVLGEMSSVAYVYDVAYFLTSSLIDASGLDTSCVIPEETIAIVAVRTSYVVRNVAIEAATGDFGGAVDEFKKVFDVFIDAVVNSLVDIASDCVTSKLIKSFSPSILTTTMRFITWLPLWFWDYFETNGTPAKVLLLYTPAPTPVTPTPELYLDLTDFLSVERWFTYAITHNQPEMIGDLMGNFGANFAPRDARASEPGNFPHYDAENFIPKIRRGLEGSSPTCVGYIIEDNGVTVGSIIVRGLKIGQADLDWEGEITENDYVVFQFFIGPEGKWETAWIHTSDEFVWLNEPLEKCSDY